MKQKYRIWIWLAILSVAILAYMALAAIPFSLDEAVISLAALNADAAAGDSTFLFTGQVLDFALLGASDTVARLIPALMGICLVMLPWFWREQLGEFGAIALSLVLLFSPITLSASRTVNSTTISLVAVGLLATGVMLKLIDRNYSDEILTAGIVLALTGGALVWDVLMAAGLTFLVLRWQRKDLIPQLRFAEIRKPLLIGALIALALTTWMGFFAGWDGLFKGLALWWHSWSVIPQLYSPLRLLLMYEPALLLAGIAALVTAVLPKLRSPTSWTLALFTVMLSLLLELRPGVENYASAAIVLALACLVSLMLKRWLHSGDALPDTPKWVLLYIVAAVLCWIPVLVTVARHASGMSFDPAYFIIVGAMVFLALQVLLILLASTVLPAVWVYRAVLSGLVLFVLLIQLSYGTNLAFVRGASPAEPLVTIGGTEDLRTLPAILDTLAEKASLRRDGLPVLIIDSGTQADQWVPLVRWALRDFDQLEVMDSVPAGYPGYVITPQQDLVSPELAGRQGMRFSVATQIVYPRPVCASLSPLECQMLAAWLLYRQPAQTPVQYNIILWAP